MTFRALARRRCTGTCCTRRQRPQRVMSKDRVPIPADTSAAVLFASDRTCCKCQFRGKTVQIHHVDEDPANNASGNLAVLCLECHNETQLRGGFGRKLSGPEVIQYRDDWLERVRSIRDGADALTAATMASGTGATPNAPASSDGSSSHSAAQRSPPMERPELPSRAGLAEFLRMLPLIRQRAYRMMYARKARTPLDTGEAYFEMVAVLQEALVTLLSYYPANHFPAEELQHYVSKLVGKRTEWHYMLSNSQGVGWSGSLAQVYTAMGVVRGLERMIEEAVAALTGTEMREPDAEDIAWLSSWRADVQVGDEHS